jgi:UDP-N-acetyl-D-mannosaminuronate dehydrogenase
VNPKEELLGKIASRSARVGIIGLGYVGLPLALVFEEAGFPVLGFDVDPKKPEALHRGESYIKHIGPDRVAAAFTHGRIAATTDFARLAECDAILICVPTPLGKHREPDISYIQTTAEAIAAVARPGQLVVLESTTYPGTTREEILPRLEAVGLKCGETVFVAFSPEREDPGNPSFHTRNIPKVVGGIDAPSGDVAEALYAAALERVIRVSTAEVAESGKLLENIFRSVNIALVNELKVVFDKMGIDVWEVIEAAKTKPFGYMPFYPGPGIGGHCLAGTESVRVRSQSFDTVLTLSALFELYEGRAKGFTADGADVVLPADLEALSVDPLTGESAWKPVSFLFRRPYEGEMVEIRLAGNRSLRTTDRHPMLVVSGGELVVRDACDLQPGDELPLTRSADAADCGSSGKPHLRIAGDASLRRLARLLEGDKGRKLDALDSSRVRRQGPRRTLRWEGGFATPVVSVTPKKGMEPVYSVEVPDSHTFAATGGVFVHNCIPLDPFYLSWKAAEHGAWARFIELAGEINTSMPHYVVDKTVKALNEQGKSIKGAKVLILGLSYKADIDDDRESPSYELIDLLDHLGAEWAYCDPFIPTARLGRKNKRQMCSVPCTKEELARHDALLVATAHTAFKDAALFEGARLVVDTRNVVVPSPAFTLVKA